MNKCTGMCHTLLLLQVEQFWHSYSHMIRPGELSGHCDYHLFKDGIRPMWEVIYLSVLNKPIADYQLLSASMIVLGKSPFGVRIGFTQIHYQDRLETAMKKSGPMNMHDT